MEIRLDYTNMMADAVGEKQGIHETDLRHISRNHLGVRCAIDHHENVGSGTGFGNHIQSRSTSIISDSIC